jgi:hypothetical protein
MTAIVPAYRLWAAPAAHRVPSYDTQSCRPSTQKHLDFLEDYVAARLRERVPIPGSMSMVERLPAWLKSADHREEMLRAIAKLRACLDEVRPRSTA